MKASDVEGEWADEGRVRAFKVSEDESVFLWPVMSFDVVLSSYIILPDGREWSNSMEIRGVGATYAEMAEDAERMYHDEELMTAHAKILFAASRTALDEELEKESA